MKDRPILFSAPMVRAILAGTKTQTRRVCKNKITSNGYAFDKTTGHISCHMDELPPSVDLMLAKHDGFTGWWYDGWEQFCPYGQPGDRLWVRETWRSPQKHIVAYQADGTCGAWMGDGGGGRYFLRHGQIIQNPADGGEYGPTKYGDKWRPSIHMPRWASRITLEITGVRVERLQEISQEDAFAEGIERFTASAAVSAYCFLWEAINGKGSWDANPWVWVVTFGRVKP